MNSLKSIEEDVRYGVQEGIEDSLEKAMKTHTPSEIIEKGLKPGFLSAIKDFLENERSKMELINTSRAYMKGKGLLRYHMDEPILGKIRIITTATSGETNITLLRSIIDLFGFEFQHERWPEITETFSDGKRPEMTILSTDQETARRVGVPKGLMDLVDEPFFVFPDEVFLSMKAPRPKGLNLRDLLKKIYYRSIEKSALTFQFGHTWSIDKNVKTIIDATVDDLRSRFEKVYSLSPCHLDPLIFITTQVHGEINRHYREEQYDDFTIGPSELMDVLDLEAKKSKVSMTHRMKGPESIKWPFKEQLKQFLKKK